MRILLATLLGVWGSAVLAALVILAYNGAYAGGDDELIVQEAVLWIVGVSGGAGGFLGFVGALMAEGSA